MATVSYNTRSSSTSTGISPFGLSFRYSADLWAALARSTSLSSNGTPSSSSSMCGVRLALPGK